MIKNFIILLIIIIPISSFSSNNLSKEDLIARKAVSKIDKNNIEIEMNPKSAIKKLEEVLKKKPKSFLVLKSLGRAYYHLANYSKAIEYHEKIRKLAVKSNNPYWQAMALHHIGEIYVKIAHYKKAFECLNKTIMIRKEIIKQDNPEIAKTYNKLGLLYYKTGQYDKASHYYNKALIIQKNVLGEVDRDIAESYYYIGLLHKKKGDYNKALHYYFKSLNICKKVLPKNHPYIA